MVAACGGGAVGRRGQKDPAPRLDRSSGADLQPRVPRHRRHPATGRRTRLAVRARSQGRGNRGDRRELLAADRALDQAWRGGIGVAMAVTRAQELSDPLRLDVLLEDAKVMVSDAHGWSPDEALARLCFVSWHTNRGLRDIASEVVTSAANQQLGFADQSTPRLYRFTL